MAMPGRISKRQNTVSIDPAGRIVIPKAIRDSLQLRVGETLKIEGSEDAIVIRRPQDAVRLQQVDGWWVIAGGASTDFSITELIDQVRGARVRELGGD